MTVGDSGGVSASRLAGAPARCARSWSAAQGACQDLTGSLHRLSSDSSCTFLPRENLKCLKGARGRAEPTIIHLVPYFLAVEESASSPILLLCRWLFSFPGVFSEA